MSDLMFPFAAPPAFGQCLTVAPGLLWLRLPLPFRLNHVNVYLLEDAEGWTVVDTGVDDAATRALWESLLRDVLGGKPVTRVIVTHFHPDHIGAAAFLCERTGATLVMGETEYLTARLHTLAGGAEVAAEAPFYRRHGLDQDQLAFMAKRLDRYRHIVPRVPRQFVPLRAGDVVTIGGRRFEVFCFGGHSPAQMLLHAAADGILLAADHILPQISPNVSVAEDRPDDDPLGLYLASFGEIRRRIAEDVLVLPGHRLPFRGLHARTRDLAAHHADRCDLIVETCRMGPTSVADLVPTLFPMQLDVHQFWFAFSEALAHVNYLAGQGRLTRAGDADSVRWSVSA